MKKPSALFSIIFVLSNLKKCSSETSCNSASKAPLIEPKTMVNGVLTEIDMKETNRKIAPVHGCCEVQDDDELKLKIIGYMPQFTKEEAMEALESSKKAWDNGMGTWPQMSLPQRISLIQQVFVKLQNEREKIVNLLMWEIGKNIKDAESEFDRTVAFVNQLILTLQKESEERDWNNYKNTNAFIKRAAIGIIMCLGPYNYPLNETYATLISSLLMGNVVILKIPTVGGLVHLLTMKAFQTTLPPGTINFISGSGRETMPPLMESGNIDALAFIGGSNAADNLIKSHPHPHRLKVFLQLEAKNMGIFFPDLFENEVSFDTAIQETISGTLSYNGQRCTALKLLFVPKEYASKFNEKLVSEIEKLRIGLPWQLHDNLQSQITPLPNQKRISYMKELINDAVSKGATIMNKNGSDIIGGTDSTLMTPTVLYPVTPEMKIYHEEQFGPIVPIVPYDNLDTVLNYAKNSPYAQQCSIFTANSATETSKMIDLFSSTFGKININASCGRSPDIFPFSGRRSSALGVMSVKDALLEFSIPTVVSYKTSSDKDQELAAHQLADSIQQQSVFMSK